VADTGQTGCYDVNGVADPTCTTFTYTVGNAISPFGEDAHYNGYPASVRTFTGPIILSGYPSDYVSQDNLTGAYWAYCPLGLSGGTCATGTASNMNHSSALTACNSLSAITFAGRTDWRLPRIEELWSTLDYSSGTNPTFVPELFSAGTASYWAQETSPLNSTIAYTVDGAINGQTTLLPTTTATPLVRCISDPTPRALQYVDNGDFTVTDTLRGLVWQQCSSGQINDATCSGSPTSYNWANAIANCENLTLAGFTDWRLPNINELSSIIDYTSTTLKNQVYFPGSSGNGGYWSSTTFSTSPSYAWYVGLADGAITGGQNKTTVSHHVRCVRGSPIF
jgi:hypothetical protein